MVLHPLTGGCGVLQPELESVVATARLQRSMRVIHDIDDLLAITTLRRLRKQKAVRRPSNLVT